MCDGDDAESGAKCNYLNYQLYILFSTLYKMVILTRLQSPVGTVGLANAPVAQTAMVLDTGLLLQSNGRLRGFG